MEDKTYVVEGMQTDTVSFVHSSGLQSGYQLLDHRSRFYRRDGSVNLFGIDVDGSILVILLVTENPRHKIYSTSGLFKAGNRHVELHGGVELGGKWV